MCSFKKHDDDDNFDALVHVPEPNHAANLIPSLCAEFYKLGWVTGTGGGISIRQPGRRVGRTGSDGEIRYHDDNGDDDDEEEEGDETEREDLIYIAPSGVQKERIRSDDLFVLRINRTGCVKGESDANADTDTNADADAEVEYIRRPAGLKPSACTPLFLAAFERRGAGACIHTHSQWAVLVTLMVERDMNALAGGVDSRPAVPSSVVRRCEDNCADPVTAKRWDSKPGPDAVLARPFQIARLEQIKGIPSTQFETTWSSPVPTSPSRSGSKLEHHSFFSTLTVPVIENTAHEEDLAASLTAAMEAYPAACAVLVLRHGVYVWGETWAAAKTRAESLDYIFRLAVEMRRDGFEWV